MSTSKAGKHIVLNASSAITAFRRHGRKQQVGNNDADDDYNALVCKSLGTKKKKSHSKNKNKESSSSSQRIINNKRNGTREIILSASGGTTRNNRRRNKFSELSANKRLEIATKARASVAWTSGRDEFYPAARLEDVILEFGPPTMMDPRQGGFAVWRRQELEEQKTFYQEIHLEDEAIPHLEPAPHEDFLYARVHLPIPEDKEEGVRRISKSIMIDRLSGDVTVRCHFMGANRATLALIVMYLEGQVSIDELPQRYGQMIMQAHQDPESQYEFEDMVAVYLEQFKN